MLHSVLTDIMNDIPLHYIFAGLALVVTSAILISAIGYITVRQNTLRNYSNYLRYKKRKKKQLNRI